MPGYKGVVPGGKPKPERYRCPQCSLLLREAMLTEEGDRVCKSCYEAHYTLCHARKPTMSLSTGGNSALFHSLKYAQLSLSPVQPRPAMIPGRVPVFTDFIDQDCLPYRAIVSKHRCAMLCNGKHFLSAVLYSGAVHIGL